VVEAGGRGGGQRPWWRLEGVVDCSRGSSPCGHHVPEVFSRRPVLQLQHHGLSVTALQASCRDTHTVNVRGYERPGPLRSADINQPALWSRPLWSRPLWSRPLCSRPLWLFLSTHLFLLVTLAAREQHKAFLLWAGLTEQSRSILPPHVRLSAAGIEL
jgi:hypothetical protein